MIAGQIKICFLREVVSNRIHQKHFLKINNAQGIDSWESGYKSIGNWNSTKKGDRIFTQVIAAMLAILKDNTRFSLYYLYTQIF